MNDITPPDTTPPASDPKSEVPAVPKDHQPWAGAEPTLSGSSEIVKPRSKKPLGEGASPLPSDQPDVESDWTGDDQTMPGATPPKKLADTSEDWDGNDRTMPGVAPAVPGDDWVGNDRTIPGSAPLTPTQADGPDEDWVGDDRTMPGQGSSTDDLAADDWVGDDRTIPGQAATTATKDDSSDEDWAGKDQTLLGADAARGTDRVARTGTGRTNVGSSTHRSRATSVSFDQAWHMDGRKGPHTGQVWGDWEIGGMLGEGGMGAVYRGKQTSLKRRVAVKVLATNLAQDPRLLQRFQLEARMTSMLSSPNLVQVFAAGQWEENHFFVMEYVEGTDLYDVIRRRREENRPFTPDEAAHIVIQAAKGLAEAGRYGMVHRDIKPSNLMVTSDGLVKIADFGIVKVLGESSLTMTGQAVGTPSYVSPEQGRGLNDIDQRSDLYSLGVVFYELLCDKKPFEATTPNALIYKHCYSEPELPREINAAISDEYQAVVLKCLNKKPENRYQNATELITDLESIYTGNALRVALASGKIGTGAAEAQRENLSWVQRNLLGLVGALVAVALLGGAGGLYYYANDQDRRATAANERIRASELFKALSVLNDPRPVPEGSESLLAEYAALSGADTDRVAVWRNKLQRIADLRGRLERLDAAVVTADVRSDAKQDLDAYQEEVGLEDPAASAWTQRLRDLAAREAALREQIGALDRLSSLTQSQRDAAQPLINELLNLAGKEDAQAQRTTARLIDFDRRRDGHIASLSALDDDNITITEAQAEDLQFALTALTDMIGNDDQRLRRWGIALTAKGKRVAELRKNLSRLDEFDLPPLALQMEVQRDLNALLALVPSTDPQLRDWQARIAATTAEIASLRDRLGVIDRSHPLPVAAWAETDRLIELCAELTGEADTDIIRWRDIRNGSRMWVAERKNTIKRIDDSTPLTFAERTAILSARDELLRIGAIGDRERTAVNARIADEDAALATLRERLAVLDRAEPITPVVRANHATYRRRVDPTDADLGRWSARIDAVDAILSRLTVLDRVEAIPAGVAADLDRLEAAVGNGDLNLLRWRNKLTSISHLRAALAGLDRTVPPPPSAASNLAQLVAFVGETDQDWQRWNTRFQRIITLQNDLALLLVTTHQDDAAVTLAHSSLDDLASLIGADAAIVQRLSARQQHLDGPGKPNWAADYGRDRTGIYADIDLPGGQQRMRFVPGGTFRMGSPYLETGRDSDELQVEVHLTNAYWLADSECSQAQWERVMPSNPSRDRGIDLPVERISWHDAHAYCDAIAAAIGKDFKPRLPSEAEWERACRADVLPWAPSASNRSEFDSVAWHLGNTNGKSREIRRRFANPLGCFDMLGNVSEWCEDGYGAYATGSVEDPLGASGELHVVRGGAWGDRPSQLRIANRIAIRPATRSAYLGFRIAATVSGENARWYPESIDNGLLASAIAALNARSQAQVVIPEISTVEASTKSDSTGEDGKTTESLISAPAVQNDPSTTEPTQPINPRWVPKTESPSAAAASSMGPATNTGDYPSDAPVNERWITPPPLEAAPDADSPQSETPPALVNPRWAPLPAVSERWLSDEPPTETDVAPTAVNPAPGEPKASNP